MHRLKILLADDMEHVRMMLEDRIEKCARGIFMPVITCAESPEKAIECVRSSVADNEPFDLALFDIDFSKSQMATSMTGHDASYAVKELSPTTIQAIVSALSESEHLEKAERNPAITRYFRRKYFTNDEIFWLCIESLIAKLHRFGKLLSDDLTIFTDSPNMIEFLKRVDRVRPDKNVIIYGDTGTGKELSARRMNANAALAEGQKTRPFVSINCGALTGDTIEARLFGYARGAFTGAHTDTKGFFDLAHGGDVFLDEFQNASVELQQVLLRVIQEKSYSPVGKPSLIIPLNARIITAVNKSLGDSQTTGDILPDMIARLKQDYVQIPALRDRPNDIELLAKILLARNGCADKSFSREAIQLLKAQPWPTNIRGLESLCVAVLEHCKLPIITESATRSALAYSSEGDIHGTQASNLATSDIEQFVSNVFAPEVDVSKILSSIEQGLLRKSWITHGNITGVAKQAGMTYNTAKRKLIQFGIFPKTV